MFHLSHSRLRRQRPGSTVPLVIVHHVSREGVIGGGAKIIVVSVLNDRKAIHLELVGQEFEGQVVTYPVRVEDGVLPVDRVPDFPVYRPGQSSDLLRRDRRRLLLVKGITTRVERVCPDSCDRQLWTREVSVFSFLTSVSLLPSFERASSAWRGVRPVETKCLSKNDSNQQFPPPSLSYRRVYILQW